LARGETKKPSSFYCLRWHLPPDLKNYFCSQ